MHKTKSNHREIEEIGKYTLPQSSGVYQSMLWRCINNVLNNVKRPFKIKSIAEGKKETKEEFFKDGSQNNTGENKE